MDRYQLSLLNRGTIAFRSESGEEKIEITKKLVVYQNENYKIGGYQIVFSNSSIEAITYRSKKYSSKDNVVVVDYDFTETESVLFVSFKNGLADTCLLTVSAVLADKNAYDAKIKRQNQAELVTNAALAVSVGPALLNVFWKKASSAVKKCIVKIDYKAESGTDYSILCKEIDGEYLSLCGLAYGNYVVTLEEYDGESLIVSTEANVSLNDISEVFKKELSEVKDILKRTSRAVGGNCVSNVYW